MHYFLIKFSSSIVLVLVNLIFAANSIASSLEAASTIHRFDGTEMTMDYHIMIGGQMTSIDQQNIQKIIFNTFREIDNIYNKWNPESELSKLNRLKANEQVTLSSQLESFLILTDHFVKLSEGRFDPTIEPLQQLWKSHLEKGVLPSETDLQKIKPAVGWDKIHFHQGKYYKDHDLTALDLGGIAKGFCVDLLVERLVYAGFNDVFVEWEGEVRANGMHPEKRPWNVMISHPENDHPQQALGYVSLSNQSVATSGDYIQKWNVFINGVETTYFHIIDSFTGKPLVSNQWSVASATVVAPTCILADALATVAMMFPTKAEAEQWSEEVRKGYPEIKFRFYSRDEK